MLEEQLTFLIFRMRSHFHGSLRRPTQVLTPSHQEASFSPLPTTSYHTQSSLSTIDGNSSLGPHLPLSDIKVAPPPTQPLSPASDIICCLCDKIADTKLIPCNHVVLCEEHTKLSKKCPECRVSCYPRRVFINTNKTCICL